MSSQFSVKTGVRQGGILGPVLFLMALNWVMRETAVDMPRGTRFTHLADVAYIWLMTLSFPTYHNHLLGKTTRLSQIGKAVDLKISVRETQLMYINTKPLHAELSLATAGTC